MKPTTGGNSLKTIYKQDEDHSIIGWLYDFCSQAHGREEGAIRRDFEHVYEHMHGKTLEETDEVIYAVCALCNDYSRYAFEDGVRIGAQLDLELDCRAGGGV